MSTYAALVSLMTTLNSIQIHPRVSTFLDPKQIQSLHKIIQFLLDFIESSNSHVLDSQIASAAHAAENVIESHVVDQILAGETSVVHVLDLEAVMMEMKSVQEKVMEFRETICNTHMYSMPTTSSKPLKTTRDVMVGSDDELIQIMERLTGHQSNLQIVPIVGMGGIVSQDYSVDKILFELGSCLGVFDCETDLETEDQLGLKLYKSLWGRRYLIVLDDIWSIEVWDKIKVFFPDNDCRSRVVITSRISNIATYLSSSAFVKNLLDEGASWRLFCGEVFLEEGCPPELEETGKKIVSECKGLPLSIVLIGGLLRNSIKTLEYWENFKRDLNSILISGNDEHCLNILSLSYNHLPVYLKPCFLYMGVFQEDENICVSKLIKIFVAEGFLKPRKGQPLEEVAEDYLKDLVDRNLILVDRWKRNGKIKYYKMHDLVREVCLKTGEREKFFHGVRMIDVVPGSAMRSLWKKNWRRLALPLASLAFTFEFKGGPLPFKFRLLRVRALRVWYDIDFRGECQKKCYLNLGLLHKLQSLTSLFCKAPKRDDFLQGLVLPSSLKKLTLENSQLHWKDLNAFGLSLPHLEVLKIRKNAFVGPEWVCVEGAFPRLKFLIIHCGDLVNWTTETAEYFPVLEKLRLEGLWKLEKIPSSIGEIHTLVYLNVHWCNESVIVSSTEILEEQLSPENEELKVEVMFVSAKEQKRFTKKLETERFASKNFTSDCYLKHIR